MLSKRFFTTILLLSLFAQLLPIASISAVAQATLPTQGQVSSTMYRVNKYWGETHPEVGDMGWRQAVYHMGNMAHYAVTQDILYSQRTQAWIREHDNRLNGCEYDTSWTTSPDADNHAAGQLIVNQYKVQPYEWVLSCTKTTIDQSMAWAEMTLDLGSEMSLNRIKLSPYQNRAYRYYIDTASSLDGPYTNVINRHVNAIPAPFYEDTFPATTARYVRLLVVGASGYGGKDSENWVSISEMELFGAASPNPIAVPISSEWPKCSASTQVENPCKNAVDGNPATRWSASFPLSAQVTGLRDSMNWWWVDATFMAMPLYAQLAEIENNPRYSEVLNVRYQYTKSERGTDTVRGLYDPAYGLWYRDSGFIAPPSSIGLTQPIFWSRGNGWVFAALARTLQVLPSSDPHYAEYLTDFKAMAAKVIAAQQPEGYWTANLLHRADFPGGESSGTSLFTFGLAWGINNGHLVGSEYLNATTKGWNWLVQSAVRSDGFLQYVQQEGLQPQAAPAESTTEFGVGVFLLAGSEIYKLAPATETIASATVNSTDDPGDGICDATHCTLREAISNLVPGGTINFNLTLPATINLRAGQLRIDKPLAINGPGSGQLIIRGDIYNTDFRILRISAAPVNITGVTIKDGFTKEQGAGIYNTGTLSLKDVVVRDNYAYSYEKTPIGGGIYNAEKGVLFLDNVIIQGNQAYDRGAGIANVDDASIYMQNTRIIENSTDYTSGFAGGIWNRSRGKFWIQIAPNGEWLPGSSLIQRNEGGGAAAFSSEGDMRMVHTTIQGNVSFNGSPAITVGGFLSIVESQVVGNGTGENYGGAMANYGTFEFVRSLMSGNSAERGTGGLTNGGNASLINSTIGPHYTGMNQGGIENSGVMTITNSTISEIRASPPHVGNETAFGIRNTGTIRLANSIIANMTINCSGPIISMGNNISSDSSCALNSAGDLNSTDPKLYSLADNGGPTLTYALLPGSPAIDAGNNAQCPTTDQRNELRPKDGNGDGNAVCDIGAFETPTLTTNKATITIRQETQPMATQDFAFYGPFGKFYLDSPDTDDGDAYAQSKSYTVNPGTYNFAQGVFQSWYLADIQCVGTGQSVNNMALRSVGITVKAGEQMICTFVTQRRANLEAIKFNDLNANRNLDAGEPKLAYWEFRFYRSDGTLLNHKVTDATGSVVQLNAIPGSYKICETQKAGWTNTLPSQLDPVLGAPCYSVTAVPGGNISLRFGNTQAQVRFAASDDDSLLGVTVSKLPDINEPESEESVDAQPEQELFLPLISR